MTYHTPTTRRDDFTSFADPDEYCRECAGTGMVTYRGEARAVNITETCDRCGGNGHKTIRLRAKT